MGNYEPAGEKEVNNVIGRKSINGPSIQINAMGRKIQQRKNEENYRARMPGMRKEIPKGETSNCYGDAAR